MAREITEKTTCDRCKAGISSGFYGGETGTFSLKFSRDYGVSGDSVIWQELCEDCNAYVGDLIDGELRALTPHKAPEVG